MSALLALLLLAAPADLEKAAQIAAATPHVQKAVAALQHEVAAIADAKLRAAVEQRLSAGFWFAPGGPCPAGHHAYPGGLVVHTLANLQHALALAGVYRDVYGVRLNEDWLRAAAAWHDAAKVETLPWREDGACGPEAMMAGTPEHHVRGLAWAIESGLPAPLVLTIASAHAAPTKENLEKLCGWLRAAATLARKPQAVACPAEGQAPLEAFVNNSSDVDYYLTGAASIAAVGQGGGWERFDNLQKGSELQLFKK